ncbi:MAG TPA: hypothetical protein VMI54_14330 [Polyangiaceae bacterium]|nr:hypothetical protein [Polyangiaceae bacterium]
MSVSLDGVRLDAGAALAPPAPEQAQAPPAGASNANFARIWRQLAREVDHGETLVRGVAHAAGAPMDAGTLIALQAGIYRYSEAIDLTVKLVDRASTAVRTILESGR